ncbi:hypothetical protein AWB80_06897 [Caballeronia pedi]|uniref:AAA+ ATPase domain-containing protein n=1 Tax=Caballeronia pedi TaxID=1777141 RepID=A0A158DHF3_9BURK|nr:AAA family ATPase [Caballeronia pedi]SAK93965.1 hypothetical protein AWB80_06897 [Caballeronia pedi]
MESAKNIHHNNHANNYSNGDSDAQAKTNVVPLRAAAQHDDIAILFDAQQGNGAPARMGKRWEVDGTRTPYDDAYTFQHRVERVAGIHELSALLKRLEGDRNACIIRGKYISDEALAGEGKKLAQGRVLRRKAVFEDQASHFALIDVDKFQDNGATLVSDVESEFPHEDPQAWALHYIATRLPEQFRSVSFHWQLSNSAGALEHRTTLKMHIWFWLSEAQTSAQMRPWAAGGAADAALFDPIQIHYTASPEFAEGVTDPVAVRSGFYQGSHDMVDVSFLDGIEAAPDKRYDNLNDWQSRPPAEDDEFARVEETPIEALARWGDARKAHDFLEALWQGQRFGKNDDSGSAAHMAMAAWMRREGVTFDNYSNYIMPTWPAPGKEYTERPERAACRAWNRSDARATPPAHHGFEVIDADEDEPAATESGKEGRANSFMLGKLRRAIDQAFIVESLIPNAPLGAIYGQPGTGKSFIALDIAYSIARGVSWRGLDVEQRNVFYVVAEGANGFRRRVEAYEKFHGLETVEVPFYTREDDVDLTNDESCKGLVADIRSINARKPAVLFIDTLANSMPNAKENATEDMNAIVAMCKKIQKATNCLVILIAHSPKGNAHEDLGIRGAGSLNGAVDFSLVTLRDEKDREVRTLRISKMKDGLDEGEQKFRLEPVELGMTPKGKIVTSMVAVPLISDPHERPRAIPVVQTKEEVVEARYRAVIHNVMVRNTEDTEKDPFSVKALWKHLIDRTEEFSGLTHRMAQNAVEDAIKLGYVEQIENPNRKGGNLRKVLAVTTKGLAFLNAAPAAPDDGFETTDGPADDLSASVEA